jgi:16S rRNA (guanine527-N7)-methyltransferase
MTEEEALAWTAARNVPRGTMDRLNAFIEFLAVENSRQNLIAASTLPAVWSRHIVDSAQLLDHAPDGGTWVDLGSGPGFPGLIVAAIGERPVDLVESRAKRVQFLQAAVEILGLQSRVTVHSAKVESHPAKPYQVISARAFAPLPRLFDLGGRFADLATTWLLPKGRNAGIELAECRSAWQGEFALVPSVTDADSSILIARGVRPGRHR